MIDIPVSGVHISVTNREQAAMTADKSVIFHALCAYRDTLNKAEEYTGTNDKMSVHYCGVTMNMPELFKIPTGLTACREQHHAWNRYEYHTADALVQEHCKREQAAFDARGLAAAWLDYYNDVDRVTKANAEDDERCARAEAAEAAELEEWYR